MVLTSSTRHEGAERACCRQEPEALLHFIVDSIIKLHMKVKNTANAYLHNPAPVGAEETAEQREKRQRTTREAGRKAKQDFSVSMDDLVDGADDFIEELPVSLRDQVTEWVASVIRVITGFFTSAFSVIIKALQTAFQTCKDVLENIKGFTRDAINSVYAIFQRRKQDEVCIPA